MLDFTARLRDEDGFSLAEMVIAALLSTIVLLATLQSMDLFTTNAAQQTRDTDANHQARAAMDVAVRDLRGAGKILTASAGDLAYTVPESTGTRIERLCVSSNYLYHSSTTTTGSVTAPAAACSTGTKVTTVKSTSSTAFTYDGASSSATPTSVKNVGITLGLDASGGGKIHTTTLRASAVRRSSSGLALTDPDIKTVCTGTGALLTLDANIPGVSNLSVSYAKTDGTALGSATGTATTSITLTTALTTVVATVTDSLGVVNILQKGIQCG
jgi:Tfp pilus assembly protein PilW